MERIKEVVKELLASRDYSSCMTKTLDLILNDKMNSLELNNAFLITIRQLVILKKKHYH